MASADIQCSAELTTEESTIDWEEVRKDATCPGCGDFYESPKLLPCFHTYCLRCIEAQLKPGQQDESSNANTLYCALCRRVVSSVIIDELVDNFSLKRLGVVFLFRQKAMQEEHLTCSSCYAPVVAGCYQCGMFFCANCKDEHTKDRSAEYHCVVSMEDLRSNNLIHPRKLNHEPPFCKEHPDKQVSLYCMDCSVLICPGCELVAHKGHHCETIAEAAKIEREVLREAMVEITRMQEVTEKRKAALEQERIKLKLDKKKKLRQLDAAFEVVFKKVEEERQKALEEVHSAAERTISTLEKQENDLLLLMEQLQSGTVPLEVDD